MSGTQDTTVPGGIGVTAGAPCCSTGVTGVPGSAAVGAASEAGAAGSAVPDSAADSSQAVSTPVVGAYVALARATAIRLTFFANGVNQSWAEHQRDMQPLVDSGQIQIANHTWDHPDIRTLT
ncbi:MAG TPA: polysaccharide deacetylase family protein, partial [Nakamurella sp.]|nr:polysaccharide deacetylase family protein [Nakamurella sp.]